MLIHGFSHCHHSPATNKTSSTVSQTHNSVNITIATPTGQGSVPLRSLIRSLPVILGLLFQRLISYCHVFFITTWIVVIYQCLFKKFLKFNRKPPAENRFNVHARIEASSDLDGVTKCGLGNRANPLAPNLQGCYIVLLVIRQKKQNTGAKYCENRRSIKRTWCYKSNSSLLA